MEEGLTMLGRVVLQESSSLGEYYRRTDLSGLSGETCGLRDFACCFREEGVRALHLNTCSMGGMNDSLSICRTNRWSILYLIFHLLDVIETNLRHAYVLREMLRSRDDRHMKVYGTEYDGSSRSTYTCKI